MSTPFTPSTAPNKDRLQPPSTSATSPKQNNLTTHLPGNPSIPLTPSHLTAHLTAHLTTPLLDELHPHLWLIAKPTGTNIDPLHKHLVKGRSIIPTEDPRLHLIWSRQKIYVKPVPEFLLNWDFWETYLSPSSSSGSVLAAVEKGENSTPANKTTPHSNITPEHGAEEDFHTSALGLLRSHAHLIPSQLDFSLAQQSHLLPPCVSSFATWSAFIAPFRDITDDHVAPRYEFGQLRLSRLNWLVRVTRPQNAVAGYGKWFYEIPHWDITGFVESAAVPLVFAFAGVSLVLGAMQVVLAVEGGATEEEGGDAWLRGRGVVMGRVFWGFSISVVVVWTLVLFLLVVLPLAGLVWQGGWALKMRYRAHRKKQDKP